MNKDQKFHLKSHVISKSTKEVTDEDMKLINKHTRRELTKEEVYVYPLAMCDNEGDRHNEYFTVKDLKALAKLFPGRTFIQDHQASSSNQHSRIFKAEVEEVPGKVVTAATKIKGQPYNRLVGYAYTIRKGNEFLIEQIEAGLLKEVSIGFAIEDMVCDICGNSFYDGTKCNHYPGETYEVGNEEKICYLRMKNPTEAYEISFVAVPAQPQAGVIKGVKIEGLKKGKIKEKKHKKTKRSIFYADFKKGGIISMKKIKGYVKAAKEADSDVVEISIKELEKELATYDGIVEKVAEQEGTIEELKPKAKMGDQYIEDLKKECIRLGKLTQGKTFNEETMAKIFDKCDVEELKEFKSQYEAEVDEKFPPNTQTKGQPLGDEIVEDINIEDYQS